MEENRQFELNDEVLDEVAGGSLTSEDSSQEEEYVGDTLVSCSKCGRETEHREYRTRTHIHGVCKICGERRRIAGRIVFDINTA